VLSFRYRSADADEARLSKSIPFQLQKLFAELQVCVCVCVRSDAKADWYWKCEGQTESDALRALQRTLMATITAHRQAYQRGKSEPQSKAQLRKRARRPMQSIAYVEASDAYPSSYHSFLYAVHRGVSEAQHCGPTAAPTPTTPTPPGLQQMLDVGAVSTEALTDAFGWTSADGVQPCRQQYYVVVRSTSHYVFHFLPRCVRRSAPLCVDQHSTAQHQPNG
jgi:hypothetical protein